MDFNTVIKKPFIIHGIMHVVYDGRARSVIGPDSLLLIRKSDGSVLLHAADLTTPRNYMSAGATLHIIDNILTFVRKNEKLVIQVLSVELLHIIDTLSTAKITISKTEKELCNKIIAAPNKYLKMLFDSCVAEFPTPHGPVDIAFSRNEVLHIVEVKRNKITVNNCHQLLKYRDSLVESGETVACYIAAPDISKNAAEFCDRKNITYVYVDFDQEET